MARIIGCEKLTLFEVTQDDNTGAKFGTAIPVPSLMGIDIKDNNSTVTFYSDDQTEQVINAFTGKTVTITLGYLTNELEAVINGYEMVNGVLVQKKDALGKNYALAFKAPMSDGGYQYVTLFKGVLAKASDSYKTKEDKVASQNISITGTFMPLTFNGMVSMKACDTDKSVSKDTISNWFTTVTMPAGQATQPVVGA